MVALGHHETKEALNSFNVINSYPSRSPAEGILVVTQTYNVASRSTAEPSLRRKIRKVADSLVENFTSRFGLAVIKKRWPVSNPKSALAVKHVRTNDIRALAVTLNGLTSFGADDFKRAEALVKARGVCLGLVTGSSG